MPESPYRLELAESLTEQAARLLSLGRHVDALQASVEACATYESLMVDDGPRSFGQVKSAAKSFTIQVLIRAELTGVRSTRTYARQALDAWNRVVLPGSSQTSPVDEARFLHVIGALHVLLDESGDAARRAAAAIRRLPSSRSRGAVVSELRLAGRASTTLAVALSRDSARSEAVQAAEDAVDYFRQAGSAWSQGGQDGDERPVPEDEAAAVKALARLRTEEGYGSISSSLVLPGVRSTVEEISDRADVSGVTHEDSVRLHRHLAHEQPDPSSLLSLLNALSIDVAKRSRTDGPAALGPRLAEVLNIAQRLLQLDSPSSHAHVVRTLVELCDVFLEGLDGPQREANLDHCTALLELAVTSMTGPQGALSRAALQVRLAFVLLTRFSERSSSSDLEHAISVLRDVAVRAHEEPESRQAAVSLLARALLLHYNRTADAEVLNEAIAVGVEAARSADPSDAMMNTALSNLSASLLQRYERFGSQEDLNAAVDLARRSLNAAGPESAGRVQALVQLSTLLRVYYRDVGHREALDESIDTARRALAEQSSSADNLGDAAALLAGLLQIRHEDYGAPDDTSDLDEAVHLCEAALASADGSRQGVLLGQLARVLLQRSAGASRAEDIQRAVDASRGALERIPPGNSSDRVVVLTLLSAGLVATFRHFGDLHSLDSAVEAAEEAAAESVQDRAARVSALGVLVNALLTRAAAEGHTSASRVRMDLDRATAACHAALRIVPKDHPAQQAFLKAQDRTADLRVRQERESGVDWQALVLEYEQTGSAAAYAEAVVILGGAVADEASLPVDRLRAAERWGRLATQAGDHREALTAYTRAITLLRLVLLSSPGRQPWPDEAGYGDIVGSLVNDAAASALSAGQPEQAAVLLEGGRAALFAHSPGPDQAWERIRSVRPELAERLEAVSRRVADPGTSQTERRHLGSEWDNCVQRIRELPGLKRLLALPEMADLTAQAHEGPLVMVNVSRHRCDALVVTEHGVHTVPLPLMRYEDLVENLARFQSVLNPAYAPLSDSLSGEETLIGVLDWLWAAVAEPVLSSLGLPPALSQDTRPPRVWWMPTGPLSLLPVHAAQARKARRQHVAADGSSLSAFESVCSSYATTIGALAAAREGVAVEDSSQLRGLVIAPDGSTRVAALAHVAREASHVAGYIGRSRVLSGDAATMDAVKALLPQASLLHFACHGTVNSGFPRTGGVELANGFLSTTSLREARSEQHQFIFVSACHSSTRDPASGLFGMDAHPAWEPVNLPAALHLAGYRHALGTLWEVQDRTHADVAEYFYKALGVRGRVDPDLSAQALWQALRRVRDRYPHIPSLWAAHIHLGP
ncbi:CHAT domain-containing protein [Streptomyces aurantiacus]|uniref:CHAT domain-containing protein n=1 Tax=Streptomyces aurantiacus TaxID=47760 RepID=UPI0006E2D2CB|nr:CHAT domain-containing protein [Streptomyces aurantiacus]